MLICGEIDLSVGQVFAPSPFIMGYAHAAGRPVVAAIVVALPACALIGLAIGLITTGAQRAVVHHGACYAVPDYRADPDDLGAQFAEDHHGIGLGDAVVDLDHDTAGKRAVDDIVVLLRIAALLPATFADRGPRDRPRPRSEAARMRHADGSEGSDFAALLPGRSLCSPGREFVWSDGAAIA